MGTRYSTSLLGLCLMTAAAGFLCPSTAQLWVVPRTPAGHPDLQGDWTSGTLTTGGVGHAEAFRCWPLTENDAS